MSIASILLGRGCWFPSAPPKWGTRWHGSLTWRIFSRDGDAKWSPALITTNGWSLRILRLNGLGRELRSRTSTHSQILDFSMMNLKSRCQIRPSTVTTPGRSLCSGQPLANWAFRRLKLGQGFLSRPEVGRLMTTMSASVFIRPLKPNIGITHLDGMR